MKPLRITSKASAPTKIILFGEHFVVYNKPSILAAINKRIYTAVNIRNDNKLVLNIDNNNYTINIENISNLECTDITQALFYAAYDSLLRFDYRIGLNINIISDVPFGSGLGTSAATIASLISSIFNLFGSFNKYEILQITLKTEKYIHGNTSGADPAISITGGLIMFKRAHEPDMLIMPLEFDKDLSFIIVYSGERRITGKMVNSVKLLKDENPTLFEIFANKSEEIVLDAVQALKSRDYLTLGSLMLKNHELLERLGVSTPTLNKLVELAINNGALGAKLTGAGGGGSVIILAKKEDNDKLLNLFKDYCVFITNIEKDGIKIE